MSRSPVLRLDNISGGYGDIKVVSGVSLAVSAGEVACITGRNGVGKTTLMRMIAGFLPVMNGQVVLKDRQLGELKPHQRNRLGLAYAPQENVVFDDLSVRENLTLHHANRSLERYGDLFAAFPRMEERLEQKAGTLSGGERKILSFCRTLAEQSDLVLLDEPTRGGSTGKHRSDGGGHHRCRPGGPGLCYRGAKPFSCRSGCQPGDIARSRRMCLPDGKRTAHARSGHRAADNLNTGGNGRE